jgi:CoA:oxalate CoA-transferase
VQSPEDIYNCQHLRGRAMLRSVNYPGAEALTVPANPVKFEAFDTFPNGKPPEVGEHTNLVLHDWLELTDGEIAQLAREGIIA